MGSGFYDIAKRLDRAVERYSKENLQTVLDSMEAKGAKRYLFVKQLPNVSDWAAWFAGLKENGYFSGGRNPRPEEVEGQAGSYRIPLWEVLPFLEKVAERNKEKPDDGISEALAEIVDDVIGYRDSDDKRIANYRTDSYMVRIMFLLPAEKWKCEYIDFIGTAGESEFGADLTDMEVGKRVLPALIENRKKELLLRMLKVMLGYRKTEKSGWTEIEPVMKNFWLKDALEKNKDGIIRVCGVDAARVAVEKIKEITETQESRSWSIAVPTVETSSQRIVDDAFECQLVDFVRDVVEACDAGDVRDVVKELIEDAAILKRIAIHATNQRYEELGDIFWTYKGHLWEEARHEGYELLKAHCKEFGDPEIEKVIEWVNAIKIPESKEREAYRRKELLSAVLGGGDERIVALYKQYDKTAPGELDHPGFPVWSEMGEVRHISPVEMEKLMTWSNATIAEYLRRYNDTKEWEWAPEQISGEGLRNCLVNGCRESPEKFASDMRPFLNVPETYQSGILRGLNEAWNARKEFPIGNVLEFMEEIVRDDGFWEKSYGEHDFNYRDWTVSLIAEFIENGTRSDSHAFEPEHMPRLEKILGVLSKKDKAPSRLSGGGRVVDSVLSSPRANVFSAMILYALRYARLYKKDESVRWPEGWMDDFTERLDKNIEPDLDFLLTLMRYLPNIAYLDKEWLFGHLGEIFPLHDKERWPIVFEGYLGYSARVYEKMYKELRERGHYAKAIETGFSEKYAREKLIQHIAIGFIEGWEEVIDEESLISVLLKKKDPNDLDEIVRFLLTIKEGESRKKLEGRIKELWRAFFAALEPEQKQRDSQRVISRLGLWLKIVPSIDDEIKEWAKLSAKYAGVGWHGEMLVEYLGRHVKNTPKHVGEIYVEMLEGGTCSDHDKGKIVDIVRCLYENGAEEHANRICNLYGEMGYYFLRETYEEHNKAR